MKTRPRDIAEVGLSVLACALILTGFYFLFYGVGDVDLGWHSAVIIVVTWIAYGVSVLAFIAAAITKVIQVGVRSAND